MDQPSNFSPSDAPKLEQGVRVLLVGASGGIGRAVLQLLGASDVTMGLHYFKGKKALDEALQGKKRSAAQVRLFQADLSVAENARKLIDSFVNWAGGIDVLIQLSGGIANPVSWEELNESDWRADLELNLTSTFFLAQPALVQMQLQGTGGRIILIGTASASHGGGRDTIAYGISKAGVESLTKGLARQGAPSNVLVNAILPGFIDTGFQQRHTSRTPADLEHRVSLIPLKRSGTPMEVAGLIAFLASPWGSYITGECIAVSGGDWL